VSRKELTGLSREPPCQQLQPTFTSPAASPHLAIIFDSQQSHYTMKLKPFSSLPSDHLSITPPPSPPQLFKYKIKPTNIFVPAEARTLQ